MYVPSGVATCLYAGISKKIDWMKDRLKWNLIHVNMSTPDNFLHRVYKDIIEAVEFYNEHCIPSEFLITELNELTIQYEEYKKDVIK